MHNQWGQSHRNRQHLVKERRVNHTYPLSMHAHTHTHHPCPVLTAIDLEGRGIKETLGKQLLQSSTVKLFIGRHCLFSSRGKAASGIPSTQLSGLSLEGVHKPLWFHLTHVALYSHVAHIDAFYFLFSHTQLHQIILINKAYEYT